MENKDDSTSVFKNSLGQAKKQYEIVTESNEQLKAQMETKDREIVLLSNKNRSYFVDIVVLRSIAVLLLVGLIIFAGI